jgi:hypothetical protein
MDALRDPVAAALDGATRDPAVSGDAMRWSPDLADAPAAPRPGLPLGRDDALSGVDAAAGLGAALGLDGAAVQRLVTGALLALPAPPGREELTAGEGDPEDPR